MNGHITLELDKLNSTISQIDSQIWKLQATDNHFELRRLIDLRRQFNSDLKKHTLRFENEVTQNYETDFSPDPKIQNFISGWCNRLRHLQEINTSFEDENFCDLFLDCTLPDLWDFQNDIVVIVDPPTSQLLQNLISRGQKTIVVIDEAGKIRDAHAPEAANKKIFFCQNTNDLEITFVLMEEMSEQVITIHCGQPDQYSDKRKGDIATAINNGKKNRLANTITAVRFGTSWSENVINNLPLIQKFPNLHQLDVGGASTAVIVASGPSLEKNVSTLSELQESVFVISALRSLPTLKSAGVKPDLVIQLDSENYQAAAKAASQDFEIRNLLLELNVNPAFFNLKADRKFWSLSRLFYDVHDHFGSKPTPFDSPSVSIYSLLLSLHLGFKNICFVGQDLAANGHQQYASESSSLLPKHHQISSFDIETPGFAGGFVKTRSAYLHQIKKCTNIAADVKRIANDIKLVNATEGGAYIEGFEHMTLRDFGQKIIKSPTKPSHKITTSELKFPNAQSISGFYQKTLAILSEIHFLSEKIIDLTNNDDACEEDSALINDLIVKFRSLNNQNSFLQLSMQDEIARTNGSSLDGSAIRTNQELFIQVKRQSSKLIDNIESRNKIFFTSDTSSNIDFF